MTTRTHERILTCRRPKRLDTQGSLLVVAVLAISLMAGCGVPADRSPKAIPADKVPFDLLTPGNTTTTVPIVTVPAGIYLIGPGRLVAANRLVAAPASLGSVLAVLTQGPTDSEAQIGLRSAVNPQTRILSSKTEDGLAFINFSEAFSGIGVQGQILALAQVVYTATQLPGVEAVQVQLNSAPVEVPRGDGTLTSTALHRFDYPALAPVR